MRDDVVDPSHLRGDGVWQCPQQRIPRVNSHGETWFVKEPAIPPGPTVTSRQLAEGSLCRLSYESFLT
ncbi:hypothetical protein IWX75_002696 [Arthrobacter sp. CAN_A6]